MKDLPSKAIAQSLVSALHNAVFKDDLKRVTKLLKKGAAWRQADNDKKVETIGKSIYSPTMNALEVAVVGNHLQIVIMILKQAIQGKDDTLLQKACHLACQFNHMKILKEFYKYQSVLVKNEFLKALKENNINVLIKLAKTVLKDEFDTIKDEQGNHILHVIASKENLTEVLKLKSSVARLINLPNRDGNTPLHTATKSNNRDVIIALTENGALVAKPNLQGDTSVHIAAAYSGSDMIKRLCKAGYLQNRESEAHQVTFDVLAKNKQNQTAKSLARWWFIAQTLEEQAAHRTLQKGVELIYQGRETDLKKHISESPGILTSADDQGDTLLHHAFTAYKQTGKSCLLEVLNAKPNVNHKNRDGLTPLLLATTLNVWFVEKEGTEHLMMIYLKELGANMLETNNEGFTALHLAVMHDDPDVIKLLVGSAGLKVNYVSKSGLEPIHIAAKFGKKQAFDALLRRGAVIDVPAYPHALVQFQEPVQTTQEITPLWLAATSNAADIVNVIFDNYIAKKNIEKLPDLRTGDNSTLLHFFASTKDFNRFKQALNVGVDPFDTNDANYLPFHSACVAGSLEIVKHYIEVIAPRQSYWNRLKGRTFDINDLPEKGINALTLAGQNQRVVQYLKEKGATAALATAERRQSIKGWLFNFYGNQTEFRGQLESTRTNQLLNLGRIVGSTILTAYKGPVGMTVAAVHQLLLYRMPTAIRNASALYYKVKPIIHNHAPRIVEVGLDEAAAITSEVTNGVFTVLNLVDIAANPSRRMAGYVTSMGMANIASRFTDNLEIQGAAYFFGREVGMFEVEAYQSYERPHSEAAMNEELSRAYNLWSSLFGKNVGECVVSTMHQFTVMHQSLRESVGWFEHVVLSYMGTKLTTIQNAVADIGLHELEKSIVSALSMTSLSTQAMYSLMQFYSREIQQLREQVLTNIEHKIVENLLPDSEHRDVTLKYLLLNQTVLLSQKLMETKDAQSAQGNKVRALEEERDILDVNAIEEKLLLDTDILKEKNRLLKINQQCDALAEQITESKKAYNTIWEKTPKGGLEFKSKEAQQNCFNEKIKIEGLKLQIQFLKNHKVDESTMTEVNNQLQEAEKALVDFQATLEATEADWLKLANPVEREQLPKHKEEMGRKLEEHLNTFKQEQSNVFEQLDKFLSSKNDLSGKWNDYKNAEQKIDILKRNFDVFDLQIKAIDNPPFFNSRDTVENALDQYPTDCDQVVRLILDKLVATGMINLEDANAQIKNSLVHAFNSHSHKADRLNKVLTHHYKMLSGDYRTSLVQQRMQLQKQIEAAVCEFKVASDNYGVQQSIVQQNKVAYEALVGASADGLVIEQIFNQPNNWDMVHNGDDIRTTLTLLGQSQMTVNAMIDSGGPSSQPHKAASLARTLVNYKYLFIAAPSIDVRLQEIDALTADLVKQTLDPIHIAVLKQNMDSQIADQLLNNSVSLTSQQRATSISNQIQNGFRYNEGQDFVFESKGSSLSQTLESGFEAQDVSSAKQAIVNVLQDQTSAISIAEAGVYSSPVVVPHVPSNPHGLKRWWDNSKEIAVHYGKEILKITGGFSGSIDSGGVSAGFTYGNQYRVMQFQPPKPLPLFTIMRSSQPSVVVGKTAGAANHQAIPGKTLDTKIDMDSPYMRDILAAQYNETLGAKVESVGKLPRLIIPQEPVGKLPRLTVQNESVGKLSKTVEKESSSKIPVAKRKIDVVDAEAKFSQFIPKVVIPSDKVNWFKMANLSVQGINTSELRLWQKHNIESKELPFLLKCLPNDIGTKIFPVADFMREVLVESWDEAKDTIKLMENLVFTEVDLALRGEELQTVKAVKILGVFIGTEAARLALKEQTATSQYIKQIAADFMNMSDRDKAKAAAKIFVAYKLPAMGMKLISKAGVVSVQKVQQIKSIELSESKVLRSASKPKVGAAAEELTIPKTVNGVSGSFQASKPVSLLTMYEQKSITKIQSFREIVISRSTPAEIYHGYGALSKRQSELLRKLPNYKSSVIIKKSDVTVNDLAALTAKTGHEFAMFTLGSRRLIIRGNNSKVVPDPSLLEKIKAENWKWSAHVHPGTTELVLNASGVPGDKGMLNYLNQERSLILNSSGRRNVFDQDDNHFVSKNTVQLKKKVAK